MQATLRKMGLDFYKDEISDVGNYMVRVEFIDKKGIRVVADFKGFARREAYTKETGKKGYKIVNQNALHIDGQYHKKNRYNYIYRPESVGVNIKDYSFTRADILRFLSDVTGTEYTEIEFY